MENVTVWFKKGVTKDEIEAALGKKFDLGSVQSKYQDLIFQVGVSREDANLLIEKLEGRDASKGPIVL